jgi:hypothetical protein
VKLGQQLASEPTSSYTKVPVFALNRKKKNPQDSVFFLQILFEPQSNKTNHFVIPRNILNSLPPRNIVTSNKEKVFQINLQIFFLSNFTETRKQQKGTRFCFVFIKQNIKLIQKQEPITIDNTIVIKKGK